MTSRGGEYLARAVLVVSATLLGLLTIEGAVRVWIAATTPTLLVLDPELGWADHANVRRIERSEGVEALVETNALGLRGPLHAGPSKGHRILILGDSFAEGRQVSNHELFSVLVERAHPRLELVNTGVIGYGTVQEALALKRWEPLVHPELVVLLVFRNDLGDNLSPFSPPIGPRPYADRSAAFRPLDWRLYAPFLPSIPGRAWLYRNSMGVQLWQSRRIGRLMHTQLMSAYGEHWRRMDWDTKWYVLDVWVGAIAEGRRLLLVACPERHDVRRGDRTFTRRLAELAARHGIAFLNLQDVLTVDDFLDIHWNARGQRTVAAYLASALLRLGT